MPVLLRRALAQLRGEPPESWPNALRAEPPPPGAPYTAEVYGPGYPFPTLERMLPRMQPDAPASQTQGVLRSMLDRLQKADIGNAWRSIETRCAASTPWPKDPGLEVLLALIEALVPIKVLDQAIARQGAERIREAARDLLAALEAYAAAGAPLMGIMPRKPTDLPEIGDVARTLDFMAGAPQAEPLPKLSAFAALALKMPPVPSAILDSALTDPAVLFGLLRFLSNSKIGAVPQRRGSMAQRHAMIIAHRLCPLSGAEAAVAIANAATGARITARAVTKTRN
jgi:hypothetical protein